jgi:bla regulator protein BlaR1
MKQSEQDLRNVMKKTLDKSSSTMTFTSLWNLHDNKNMGSSKYKRAALVPLIVIFTLLTCFTIGFAGLSHLVDKTDLPFVDDPEVIGRWEAVDFVNNISDFDFEKHFPDDELYLSDLAFIKGGKMLDSIENTNLVYSDSIWTKGVILNTQMKTASKYEIKEMNGSKYMFYEWKSGDYIIRFMKPKYYVLKQVNTEDYSNYEISRTEDRIDYPFVNNPEMLGKWKSVDFVKEIDEFKPTKKQYAGPLFLGEINILENGNLTVKNMNNELASADLSWTENLIIDKTDITASKCDIRTIKGQTYMFYQWKSGDYVFRGMNPSYYVLKKIE